MNRFSSEPASNESVMAALVELDGQLMTLAPEEGGQRAAVYLQKAILYLSLGDWQQGAAQFAEIAQLAAAEGESLPLAQALYAQGLALQGLAATDEGGESRSESVLQRAAELFEQLGQQNVAQEIRQSFAPDGLAFQQQVRELSANPEQLQAFLEDSPDVERFFAQVDRALERFGRTIDGLLNNPLLAEIDPETRVDLFCFRAQWYEANEQGEAAQGDWESAIAYAEGLNRPDLLEKIQARQRGQGDLLEDFPSFDPLSALEESLRQGLLPVNDEHLEQAMIALQNNQWQQVLDFAILARKKALVADNPDRYTRYLWACLLMTLAQEGLGDDVGALESLLMCKATLDQSLASASGQQVNQFVEGLEQRWGCSRFEEAKAGFKRKMSERCS
ncbi:hypothetical protein K4A83_07245 [Spirulina subsalsa FACHB-351]|uniref:Uncharacterized protein n=1 Tax=Spirulina subsalsa FACHB-351 TaxID=234711 RepID=A0ABT3L3I8_9CYAN|nr:hypothetical protein [Spirulina subsalsa]MCW6036067.1 hypothetical protein [Spirulina subsalsa FACHB-351]